MSLSLLGRDCFPCGSITTSSLFQMVLYCCNYVTLEIVKFNACSVEIYFHRKLIIPDTLILMPTTFKNT
jgi:hypothetical protein